MDQSVRSAFQPDKLACTDRTGELRPRDAEGGRFT